MTIKIYKLDLSPPARAAVITAELLKLNYVTQDVDLMAGEQMTPEFLEKNPLHSVPVLEDDDFVLADSHAIMPYLITKYGSPEQQEKLYPSDFRIRATITQRMFFESTILIGAGRSIVIDLLDGKKAPTEKQIANMNEAYAVLDKYLQKSKYVAGDRFTIADMSLVVAVSATNVYVPVDPKYTKVHAWWNLLKKEDWYTKINEPGVAQYEQFIKAISK